MPMTASATNPAPTAASKTANFAQKPNSGGMPARLNMKTTNAAASQPFARHNPASEAIVNVRPVRVSGPVIVSVKVSVLAAKLTVVVLTPVIRISCSPLICALKSSFVLIQTPSVVVV